MKMPSMTVVKHPQIFQVTISLFISKFEGKYKGKIHLGYKVATLIMT